eukprot:6213752-Amphidinium_carterae.1
MRALREVTGAIGVTEHSLRRSGAQWHARRGVPIWAIKVLGRWKSDAVDVYLGEALHESVAA